MSLPLWGTLYDAVALGMYGYARAAHRVRVVAPRDERIVKGTLYVAAHRAETDVPIICGAYYFAARVWGQRRPRLHFAARDDLFQPGFFAGFPPNMPQRLRRALHPIGIGRYLSHVRVHPISSAVTMRLVQALELIEPETSLDDALFPEQLERFRARADEAGVRQPERVGDILSGTYADLLWHNVEAADLPEDVFAGAWARRAAVATGDLRTVVELVADGEPLLLFPEGRPSPDGDLGPLRRGLGAVIRRGKPERLRAFGLAYDPLTVGRDTVVLSVMPSMEPPTGGGEPDLLPYLARAIALTSGQVVAAELTRAARSGTTEMRPSELESAIVDACEAAVERGRLVDPVLDETGSRRLALEDSVRAAASRGLLRVEGKRTIAIDPEAVMGDHVLARLEREFVATTRESARA